MVITDHDSYKGYEAWANSERSKTDTFKVIKGIEYDTCDGGHIIVIMPEQADTKIFELRGMKVRTLADIVHKMGGILGPAHPFEYRRLGIANNRKILSTLEVMNEFDFIEGFNSCCGEAGNFLALGLAKSLNKQTTAGSDAHKIECVGKARVVIDAEINTAEDFIKAIKENKIVEATGEYHPSTLVKHRRLFETGLYGFYLFNKIQSFRVKWRREAELARLMAT